MPTIVDFNQILHKNIKLRHAATGREVPFYVADYQPNEMGKMDIWCTCLRDFGVGNVSYKMTYTGHRLAGMGFEIPTVTHENVRDKEMGRLAGMLRREQGVPTAESLVAALLDQ